MCGSTNGEALHHLNGFTGTEQYHRYGSLLLTDGVKFLADKGGAYWLLDIINSYQPEVRKDQSLSEFQIWKLRPMPEQPKYAPMTVGAVMAARNQAPPRPDTIKGNNILVEYRPEDGGQNPMAYVTAERDTDDVAVVQYIPFTNFPFEHLPEAKIYVAPTGTEDGKLAFVAMLPSEY